MHKYPSILWPFTRPLLVRAVRVSFVLAKPKTPDPTKLGYQSFTLPNKSIIKSPNFISLESLL